MALMADINIFDDLFILLYYLVLYWGGLSLASSQESLVCVNIEACAL